MQIMPNATETLRIACIKFDSYRTVYYMRREKHLTQLELLLVGVPSYLKASDKSRGVTAADFTIEQMIK